MRPHLRHTSRLTVRPDGTQSGQLLLTYFPVLPGRSYQAGPTRNRQMLWGGRRGTATSSLHLTDGGAAMPQPNDLSRSLVELSQVELAGWRRSSRY